MLRRNVMIVLYQFLCMRIFAQEYEIFVFLCQFSTILYKSEKILNC